MTTEDVFAWAGVALAVLGVIILVASTCMVAYLAYINSGYNPDPVDRMLDRGSYKRSIGPAFGGIIISLIVVGLGFAVMGTTIAP